MECLNQILSRSVRFAGDRPLIISEERILTYNEFAQRTARLAHVLADSGVKKGDPVGLYLGDNLMMAIGLFACQRVGAIPTPMSAMYRSAELRNVLGKTQMKMLIADAAVADYVFSLSDEFPALKRIVVSAGLDDGEAALLMAEKPAQFDDVACNPDDVACLFFTSGSTGAPKGTMQTQFGQYSALRDMMVSHHSRFGSETYLCAASLFTNLGATINLHLAIFTGGTLVLHDRWDTRKVLDAIRRHRVTIFTGMPTMFIYLTNGFDPARDDISSLRLCLIGGSPVAPAVVAKFQNLSNGLVRQVYGATEAVGQVVMEPVVGLRKPGSSGIAIGSTRIRIVDDQGRQVAVGQTGQIVIDGDTVGRGYWNDPEATVKSFTTEGWLSGDIGYIDEDGYLFVVDRMKDLIIAGGHNIIPMEVEDAIYSHPSINLCAVLGVPDDLKGEVPVAVVSFARGDRVSGSELIGYCRSKIAAYKVPRRIYAIDEMPVQGGKILKRELLAAIKDKRLLAME